LYASSREERDQWVVVLQEAAQVKPIDAEYTIGKQLGEGKKIIY
jgi:hypothetical protein